MATAKVVLRDRHEHPLTCVAEAEPFKCSGCNEDGYHVRYACRSRSCSRPFHLHEACAQQFGSSLPHPLNRGNLLFRDSPSQPEHPCRACGGDRLRLRAQAPLVRLHPGARHGPAPLLRRAPDLDRASRPPDSCQAGTQEEAQVPLLQVRARQVRR